MSRPHPGKNDFNAHLSPKKMMKKWLFMLFIICKMKTENTPSQSLAKTINDHRSDGSGSPDLAGAAQIRGNGIYEVSSIVFLYGKPD